MRHLDVHVDAIEQRAGNLGTIALHLGGSAIVRTVNLRLRSKRYAGNRESKKQDQFRLKAQYLSKQLKAEKHLTSALARACAELAAEKIAMRDLFEDERLSFQ